jgi:hypothetical protein
MEPLPCRRLIVLGTANSSRVGHVSGRHRPPYQRLRRRAGRGPARTTLTRGDTDGRGERCDCAGDRRLHGPRPLLTELVGEDVLARVELDDVPSRTGVRSALEAVSYPPRPGLTPRIRGVFEHGQVGMRFDLIRRPEIKAVDRVPLPVQPGSGGRWRWHARAAAGDPGPHARSGASTASIHPSWTRWLLGDAMGS